jgi:hypothetical protein
MLKVDPMGMFGILAGIILGLGFFALVAFLIYLFIFKKMQMNHELRLEMIKKGMNPVFESNGYGTLKAGIILTCIGLAFLIVFLFDFYTGGESSEARSGEMILPMVPIMLGVGFILFHVIVKRLSGPRRGGNSYVSDSPDS